MRFGMGYGAWTAGEGRHFGRGHGRWGRGMDDGEGRRGRRRVFDGGELKLVLLKLIADQPRHGYDLIRAIEELTGGAYAPSPGVVYPTLTMLDEMDLIEERQTEGAKKQFAATEAGRAHLAEQQELVDALIARLEQLGSMQARSDNSAVKRAMMNLRAVLHNRLHDEALDAETLHRIVGLIDEAAQKIERL